MSIQVGNYHAEGPFGNPGNLAARSGVYVILGRPHQAANWNVVDVGESGDIQTRVECMTVRLAGAGKVTRSWRSPRYTAISATACSSSVNCASCIARPVD